MSISVLIEPTESGFRAETGGPLNLSAEAASTEAAIDALQAMISQRIRDGATLVELPVTGNRSLQPAGRLAEHPLFDEWLSAVQECRRLREVEEDAAESRGD